jgi:hypothetical protein
VYRHGIPNELLKTIWFDPYASIHFPSLSSFLNVTINNRGIIGSQCEWNNELKVLWKATTLRKCQFEWTLSQTVHGHCFSQDGRRKWTIDTLFFDGAVEVVVLNQFHYPGYDVTLRAGDCLLLQLKVCIDGPSLTVN